MFGRRAAEVVAEGARQREAEGVFLMTSGTTDDVAKVRAKFIDANKRRFGLRDGGVGPVARCQTHQPTQAAGPSEGVGPRVRIRLAPATSQERTGTPARVSAPSRDPLVGFGRLAARSCRSGRAQVGRPSLSVVLGQAAAEALASCTV